MDEREHQKRKAYDNAAKLAGWLVRGLFVAGESDRGSSCEFVAEEDSNFGRETEGELELLGVWLRNRALRIIKARA